jgi:glycerol-3-phosphate dehydrogenase (NAD(P)+)
LTSKTKRIGIIGAGGWGTVLAGVLAGNGHDVTVWSFEDDVVADINNNHRNSTYLPEYSINTEVKATSDSSKLNNAEIIVQAVPTQYIRPVLLQYDFDFNDKIVVNVAKGIEENSLYRVSEILDEVVSVQPGNYVVLTGPSHAEEVAKHIPTTVVAASEVHDTAELVQNVFTTPVFRVYTSEDVIGCELGGSLKNVIAIAAGIIDGLGLGDNTKAALITRGLAEITRLGVVLGANSNTFSGLSGLGDLFVTCSSMHSRNRFVGEQIGRGRTLQQIQSDMKMVAEGVSTTQSAYALAQRHDVELPIVTQVHRILFEDIKPADAIQELMTRQTKREWWW